MVSVGMEGATEVEDQSGKSVTLSNENIDAMNKDQLYHDILNREIKGNNSTAKKDLNDLLKVEMKNSVRNVTIAECKKKLAHFRKRQRGAHSK